MSSRPPKRHLEALRAVAVCRGGMRLEGHRTAMEALEEIGLVEAREMKSRPVQRRWFLTAAGRELLRALGNGEPED